MTQNTQKQPYNRRSLSVMQMSQNIGGAAGCLLALLAASGLS